MTRRATSICIAAGLVVGLAVGWLRSEEADFARAQATIDLDGDQVNWPMHDAVLAEAADFVTSAETIESVAEAIGSNPDLLLVEMHVPRNQGITEILVEAPTQSAATEAADRFADLLVERSAEDRASVAAAEVDAATTLAAGAARRVADLSQREPLPERALDAALADEVNRLADVEEAQSSLASTGGYYTRLGRAEALSATRRVGGPAIGAGAATALLLAVAHWGASRRSLAR